LITSFTPTSGLAGVDTVQITGGNFFGVTAVTIGGASSAYTLTDGTRLSAPVPAGAAFGNAPISITNAQGTGVSATNFSVTYGIPTITGVNPTQGPVGTPVVITGTSLGYPGTTLSLNGVAIATFTNTTNQITFTVPVGATSGNLVVTTPGGIATSPSPFTVNNASTTLDLHIEKVQLTQSTQTLDNTVPIVAGKPGLVRAFVLANQVNTATPLVQVTLLNNGVAVAGYPKLASFSGTSVPTVLAESSLAKSWNLTIPATDLVTPTGSGYSLHAVVNAGGNLPPETDSTNNTITVALTGTTVPTFKTTIFPVVLSSGTGNVTAGNKDTWAARLVKMYPVGLSDVVVGTTFTDATISNLASDGTGWNTLLNDLVTKHQADGASDRYYFGALNVSYASGVAGLGYVPSSSSSAFYYRTAIGWDKTGYSDGGNYPEVFAHETGHNMGRNHSPCPTTGSNIPAGIDPNYPYAGASIGVWGYDNVIPNTIYSPATYKDIMAYCSPDWVSDYTYKGILNFRAGSGGFLVVGAEDAPLPKAQAVAQECLIVRGIVHDDGSVELLPSFRTKALPTAPVGAGEYTLAGLDAKGATLFTAPIELMELGCWPKGHERHFLMALPYDAALLDALGGLNILKGGQVLTSLRTATATMAIQPDLLRLSEERVQLTWDASVHPTVMVRDADSGEVIAILGGGQQSFATRSRRFDLVLSDGVTGRTHHLETPN
ncbi:MAG TPA: zinc-dependent metalloprotease family protein, partial [Geothrix sp.]